MTQKPYVECEDDRVYVRLEKGIVAVRPNGSMTIVIGEGVSARWDVAAYSWRDGVVVECPWWFSEDECVALQRALREWSQTEEGREWCRAWLR